MYHLARVTIYVRRDRHMYNNSIRYVSGGKVINKTRRHSSRSEWKSLTFKQSCEYSRAQYSRCCFHRDIKGHIKKTLLKRTGFNKSEKDVVSSRTKGSYLDTVSSFYHWTRELSSRRIYHARINLKSPDTNGRLLTRINTLTDADVGIKISFDFAPDIKRSAVPLSILRPWHNVAGLSLLEITYQDPCCE